VRPSVPRGRAPGAQRYRDGFVEHVHRLLAMGYELLAQEHDTGELQAREETEITGLLSQAMDRARHDDRIRDWAWIYAVSDDAPINDHGLEGKRRPRIDIQVRRQRRVAPEPCFHFEAKRLYSDKCIAEYVGREGLKSLLDGWYARQHADTGMLAYVQAGSCEDWANKVSARLGRRPADFALPEHAVYWKKRPAPSELKWSFTSSHPTAKGRPLEVHHTFLLCC
jgi:hypothetical protein